MIIAYNRRMIVFGLRNGPGEVLDRLTQRRQLRAVVQHDRFVKALRPAVSQRWRCRDVFYAA